ncbi:MAG: hypothetical protein COV66_07130 [Nitrospinae bacterium CG11_big_fil_rev_8_21_14_0_20_45_15]|nr:MAG: hypothetical protein COV66_07130 [Nitrospinae bacterium CG11_big_fil_rev_8_21_14_0_20_45_15]
MTSTYFIRILILMSIFLGELAPASANVSSPAHLKLNNVSWIHHSSGIRSYNFVDIYQCALYFPDKGKPFESLDLTKLENPVAIRVEVLTSMLPDHMPDVWRETIKPEIIDKAFRRFQKGFLSLEEGDVLIFMYLPGEATSLFLNEKLLFADPGPGLMEALIEQWVGSHPISEDLKEALMRK